MSAGMLQKVREPIVSSLADSHSIQSLLQLFHSVGRFVALNPRLVCLRQMNELTIEMPSSYCENNTIYE